MIKILFIFISILFIVAICFGGWEVVEDQTRLLSPDGTETLKFYRDIDNDSVYMDWTFGGLVMQGGNVTLSGASSDIQVVSVTGGIKFLSNVNEVTDSAFDDWTIIGDPDNTLADWTMAEARTPTNYITPISGTLGLSIVSDGAINVSQDALVIGREYTLVVDVGSHTGLGIDIFSGGQLLEFNIVADTFFDFIAQGTDITIRSPGSAITNVVSIEAFEFKAGPIGGYAWDGSTLFNGQRVYVSDSVHPDGFGGSVNWDIWYSSIRWELTTGVGIVDISWNSAPGTGSFLGSYDAGPDGIGLAVIAAQSILTADEIIATSLDPLGGVYTDSISKLTSTVPTSGILGYWDRQGTTLTMSNLGDVLDMEDSFILNAGYVLFDTDFSNGSAEGRLQWNTDDGTLEVGMPGGNVNLQIGQEMLVRVTNDTASQIDNGTPVYISGATGSNILVAPADADFAGGVGFRTFAVATEDIAASQKGFVTTEGFVRDIDTSFAVAAGLPAYVAVGGGFTTTAPTAPDITHLVGIVTIAHATAGEIYVFQTSIPNLNSLSDVSTSGISNNQILKWDSAADVYKNTTPSVDIPIVLTEYDAEPARASESNIHGAFIKLDDAASVSSGVPFVASAKGIGKIVIAIIAGADVLGDITVTGTSVDRDSGATTPNDTSVITLTGVTSDNSTTDLNGNSVHAFTKAYITDKWFVGVVTLSTTDVTISDMDIYHISFEQFNDQPSITLNTFDVNLLTTSVNAEFDAYLFDIHVTGDECDIENESSLHIGANGETALANQYWRLRRGNLNESLNGTTDGIWVDMHFSNSPAFVEDVTMKVWATCSQLLTLP
jgi:hypothetical protein